MDPLTQQQRDYIELVEGHAKQFRLRLHALMSDGRAKAIVVTKIDEARLWAIEDILKQTPSPAAPAPTDYKYPPH